MASTMAEDSIKNVVCRYYLSNTCRDGDNCPYSHDTSTGFVDNVCCFYQKGICRYGAKCSYDHIRIKSDGSVEVVSLGRNSKHHEKYKTMKSSNKLDENCELAAKRLCQNYLISGWCQSRHCSEIHGAFCSGCEKYVIHPFDELAQKQHKEKCRAKDQFKQHSEAAAESADLTCTICMEVVVRKRPYSARRFGLLENCPHVMCLICIRTWRALPTSHGLCPVCRTKSFLVIPSSIFAQAGPLKQTLILEYKKTLAKKDCKYLKRDGKCPAVGICLYKHEQRPAPPATTSETDRRSTTALINYASQEVDFDTELTSPAFHFGNEGNAFVENDHSSTRQSCWASLTACGLATIFLVLGFISTRKRTTGLF